jgi:hypothetical protein
MTRTTPLTILAVALSVLLITLPAAAQKFIGNPMSRLDTSPPLTRSELRVIDSIIGLTPDQRELTSALYDDFFERFQTEAAEIESQVIALIDESIYREDGNPLQQAEKLAEQWNERREDLRKSLVSDLRLLLDLQQVELWPKVEREMRRNELLPSGRLAGEQVDLIRLVDTYAQGWDTDAELVALLDQYAERLDRALIARRTILDSDDAAEYPMLVKDEPLRAAEIFEDVRAQRVRIRDVNISALGPITQRLSDDDATQISRAFHQQATEHLIPPSMTEARVRSAASLPTLSDEQRERIADAIAQLEQRKQRWTRSFFDAVAEAEEDALPPELAWAVARAEADPNADPKAASRPDSDPLGDIMAERLEIDRDAWRQVSAILTPQQRADVPRPIQDTVRFGSVRPRGL